MGKGPSKAWIVFLKSLQLAVYLIPLFILLLGIASPLLVFIAIKTKIDYIALLSDETYHLLNHICHQLPSRSFWILGAPMGICSRCTGLYLSFVLTYPFIVKKAKLYGTRAYKLGVYLLIPVLVDGGTQWLDIRVSSNTIRFLTGFLGGIGLAMMAASVRLGIIGLISQRKRR